MKRYAFIDVANTKGSATTLGFKIAPDLLISYLKDQKWSCADVFWYSGRIHNERNEKAREKLEQMGYVMRDKDTHFFKKRDSKGICGSCGKEATFVTKKGKMPKANCDVELTVDCLELAGPDVEFLIFTGDGDFHYLIKKLVEKGVNVRLISTAKPDWRGDYRLSTRLRELLAKHEANQSGKVIFTELNNIRHRIGRNIAEGDSSEDPL